MVRAIASVLCLLALAGCSLFGHEHPTIVNPAAPGISYRYQNSVAEVRDKAERYCGQWGKKATLSKTAPAGDQHIATFDCE